MKSERHVSVTGARGNLPRSFSVVGTGRMASALVPALCAQGIELDEVYSRTDDSACAFVDRIGCGRGVCLERAGCITSELLLLMVSDDLLESVSDSIAQRQPRFDGISVVHTSGRYSSDILDVFRTRGASTGSMHPLQTVVFGATENVFHGASVMIEGDDISMLRLLASSIGSIPHEIDSKDKVRIHTAAVMASNYVVTLLYMAGKLLEGNDLNLSILEELTTQTVQNVFRKGPGESLTGPIARADVETVRTQLRFLGESAPELLSPFSTLSAETILLAESSGDISSEEAEILWNVIGSLPGGGSR